MSTFKARGIVIKEAVKGEADKVLTLFCKDIGKITVIARGARKPKSKYLAGSQLFTYSDFVIYNGKSFFSVTQIDIIESFYNIRTDYERLCCGSYILKILDKVIFPNLSSDELLKLLLKAFLSLSSNRVPAELIRIIFELKLLEYEGYMPETDVCVQCGCENFSPLYFGKGGLLCYGCSSGNRTVIISETTLHVIRHILIADLSELFKFNVSEIILDELRKLCYILMKSHFEGVI